MFRAGAAVRGERLQTVKPVHAASLPPAGQFGGTAVRYLAVVSQCCFLLFYLPEEANHFPLTSFKKKCSRSLTKPPCRRCAGSLSCWRGTWSIWFSTTSPKTQRSLTSLMSASSLPQTLSREAASYRSPFQCPLKEYTRSSRGEGSLWVVKLCFSYYVIA